MIRFSAGLVVVAIGVLIGGVATSKLSLVYVAIAVSAVALVALAIGVALKRDELFGGGPGLAPAGAGVGSGMPVGQSADTGDVRGSDGDVRKDQQPIRPKVPGPATIAFEAAAAASAAPPPATAPTVAAPIVAAPTVAAPSVPAPPVGSPVGSRALDNPPLGQRRPAFGQTPSREADSAADWETRLPQPPWSSGDQVRPTPTWTPRESTPKEPQPGATPGAPRAWGSPDQPPAPPAPATRTGSAIDAQSWFDRLNQPVADPSARTDTDPAKTQPAKTQSVKTESAKADADPSKADPSKAADGDVDVPESTSAPSSGWSWSDRSATPADDDVSAATVSAATQTPADAGDAGDDDDDWPTRYSWLEDDETDEAADAGEPAGAGESAEADEPAVVDEVDEVDEVDAVVPGTAGAAPATVPAATVRPATATAEAVEAVEAVAAKAAPAESATLDAPASLDADAGEDADAADVADATEIADAADDEPGETVAADATDAAAEPPALPGGVKLVAVIPGVPRYHEPDCILIRFMDAEDIAKKSVAEAQAANCTPCAACQPEN